MRQGWQMELAGLDGMVPRDFRRILIIKPSSFGDVIHALPVLHGLRQRFPHARISWLVSTACAGLLEGHPELDEIVLFDRRRFGRLGQSWRVTCEFAAFVRELNGRRFDLALDLQGLFRSGFLSLASGAAVRMGFARAREFGWVFYTRPMRESRGERHAVDRNYQAGRLLGFADVPIQFRLPVDASSRRVVAEWLAAGGIGPGRGYALLAPGTRWETKRWPVGHFAEVARSLRNEHGLAVVLAGAPDEVEAAAEVANLSGGDVVNLAGRTNLRELIALVAGASVVVMNDTGPMHLAAALGRPLVAIYGPTSPVRTGPYRRPDAVARLDLPCSPCYLKRLSDCPHGHRCLRELTPAMVCRRVAALLAAEVH